MTLEEIKDQVAIEDGYTCWEQVGALGVSDWMIDQIAQRYAQSQKQELTDWKESMMKVHSELDLQGIGRALGLPLGSSIAPQVLPEIIGLIEQNSELVFVLQNIANMLEVDAKISVESIKRVLTKYNHLKSNTNETDKI